MCDYSLMHVASRSAAVGDKLITATFSGTVSHGFAGVDDPNTAVCVLPGTEIAFDKPIVSRVNSWNGATETHEYSVGVFRQIDTAISYAHHDALEFPNGQHVKLNDLEVGQTATVLQMPAAPKTEEEAKSQQRLEVVG